MPLVSHLGELRKRLVISLVAIGVGAVVGFCLWNWVLEVATRPYCDAQAARGVDTIAGASSCQLYITSPLELFTTRLTIGTYIGLILATPVIFFQLWRFITPGLEPKEKRYAVPFVVASVAFFFFGCALAWYTFPRAMEFFLAVGGDHILTLFNPGPYLKLVFLMMVAFGVVFQLPILLVCLELAGVLTSRSLRNWRRYAIVINFAAAAVVTPSQDPYSMLMMAIPLCIFYEIAIVVGRLAKK